MTDIIKQTMTKVIETHPELEELLKEFKTETVAEEALRILEPIPEEKWCMHQFFNSLGQRCAIGHYSHAKFNRDSDGWSSSLRLNSIEFINEIRASDCHQFNIGSVNNGDVERYPQPTPKQRVIALLQDMIKAGY